MILYMLCIHASNRPILANNSTKPLNSMIPFKSANDRFIYDVISVCIEVWQASKDFHIFLEIVHRYMKQSLRKDKPGSSICQLKLLYITSIISQFGIGDLNFAMLDLAKECDEQLVVHWNKLCSLEITDIIESSKKTFQNYDEIDYYINKSISNIVQSYVTLAFEIILFQRERGRFCWQENKSFEKFVRESIGKDTPKMNFFVQYGCISYIHNKFDLLDVIKKTLNLEVQ